MVNPQVVECKDATKALLHNRDRLTENLHPFTSASNTKINSVQRAAFDTFVSILKKDYPDSVDRYRLNRIYFFNSNQIFLANSGKCIVSDSIDFNFLIETLANDTGFGVIFAYDILTKESDIVKLRGYRNKIKESFSCSPKSNIDRKVTLLTLATDSTMLLGLSNDTSSLEGMVRKRLTDTLYENNLIRTLDSNKLFYEKEGAIYQLLLQGNRRSLMALVKHFNEPLFNISNMGGPCTSMTLRMPIIEGMGRFYPDVPLLTDSLYLLKMNDEKKRDRAYVAWYFREFLNWAKQEFGVEPKDPELPPVISQGCRTY